MWSGEIRTFGGAGWSRLTSDAERKMLGQAIVLRWTCNGWLRMMMVMMIRMNFILAFFVVFYK